MSENKTQNQNNQVPATGSLSRDLKENEFQFEHGVVGVIQYGNLTVPPTFYFEASGIKVESNKVQVMNKDLYAKILPAIADFQVNREAIQKQREQAEQEKRAAVNRAKYVAWEIELRKVPAIMRLNPVFQSPETISCNEYGNWLSVRFNAKAPSNTYVTLHPAGETWDGYHYRARQDGKQWVVEDNSFKKTLHTTIEKAAAKIDELLRGYEMAAAERISIAQAIEFFANEVGLVAEPGYDRHYPIQVLRPKESMNKYEPDFQLSYNIDTNSAKGYVYAVKVNLPIALDNLVAKSISFELMRNISDIAEIRALVEQIRQGIQTAADLAKLQAEGKASN